MSQTTNYGLYLNDDSSQKFKEWRDQINGPVDSNMIKIDTALKELADEAATVPVQDTAPEGAETYDLWIDTSVDGNSTAAGGVTSVNGQKGDVVIEIPVTSVNGQTGDVTIEVPDISTALPVSGGIMTGSLTLSADPTNEMEAATKQYVDAQIAALIGDALEASY